MALPDGPAMLLGTECGSLRSPAGGAAWTPVAAAPTLCFAAGERLHYVGKVGGVEVSGDGGLTWTAWPPSPLPNLQWLLTVRDTLLVSGTNTPPVRRTVVGRHWRPRHGKEAQLWQIRRRHRPLRPAADQGSRNGG